MRAKDQDRTNHSGPAKRARLALARQIAAQGQCSMPRRQHGRVVRALAQMAGDKVRNLPSALTERLRPRSIHYRPWAFTIRKSQAGVAYKIKETRRAVLHSRPWDRKRLSQVS